MFPPTLKALRETLAGRLYHYYPAKLSYLLLVSFTFAGLLCALDGVPYLAALFQCISAATGVGLVSIDISTLSTGSQVVLLVAIVGAGPVLGSAVMPLTRWWNARAALAAHVAAVARSPPRSARAKHQEHQMMAARTLLRDALLVGALMVLAYWAAVQLALFTVLASYSSSSQGVRALLAARGVSPLWFSTFHTASTFSNSGLTLFTDSLVAFAEDRAVLLTTAFAIPLGNVAAPVVLRCLLCAAHALSPRSRTLDFLVRHPRVAFYNVFDAPATVQLCAWVVLFFIYQLVSFLATDFGKAYLAQYSQSSRALIALFSAVSTRTAGFSVVNMIDTSVSQQLVCASLMYLSATPLLAALAQSRKENTANPETDQLESSLLAYVHSNSPRVAGEGEGEGSSSGGSREANSGGGGGAAGKPSQPASLVQGFLSPLQSALPYDSLFAVVSSEGPLLLLALLLMCYAEDTLLSDPAAPRERSVFGIAFELVSAYGNTGLSLSPTALSTSAYFSTFSKLLIMAVMLAARMRGLPLDVDELSKTHALWEGEQHSHAQAEEGHRDADAEGGHCAREGGEGGGRSSPSATPQGAQQEQRKGEEGEEKEEDQYSQSHSLSQGPSQEPTVNDGHAFTVGVQLLLGGRGGMQRKSMRSAFLPVPEGSPVAEAKPPQHQRSGSGAEG